MDPIVAVYAVTVTVRAKADTAEGVPINVSAMPIAAVIEAIEAAIEEGERLALVGVPVVPEPAAQPDRDVVAGHVVPDPGGLHALAGDAVGLLLLLGIERLVVAHELLHIEVTRDKNEKAKVAVAKHDVEDFVAVMRLYGPVVGASAAYIRAATVRSVPPQSDIACVGNNHVPGCEHMGGEVPPAKGPKA